MGRIVTRQLDLPDLVTQSVFLWGPRRTGKSYWIRHHLAGAPVIDLLQTDVFAEYASRPALLRERFSAPEDAKRRGPIVIDEVQKLPVLLDEVHWLIENRKLTFLLTGSSARKLRRGHVNLLAGRARRREMARGRTRRPLRVGDGAGHGRAPEHLRCRVRCHRRVDRLQHAAATALRLQVFGPRVRSRGDAADRIPSLQSTKAFDSSRLVE